MNDEFHLKIVTRMLAMMLKEKDRFEEPVKQAREDGVLIRDDINYEDMKALIDQGFDRSRLSSIAANTKSRSIRRT